MNEKLKIYYGQRFKTVIIPGNPNTIYHFPYGPWSVDQYLNRPLPKAAWAAPDQKTIDYWNKIRKGLNR